MDALVSRERVLKAATALVAAQRDRNLAAEVPRLTEALSTRREAAEDAERLHSRAQVHDRELMARREELVRAAQAKVQERLAAR